MTRLFLILFAIFISSSLLAQHINVSFKLVNAKNEAIPYASVTVVKKDDGERPQSKVADSSGIVSFSLVKEQYVVRISSTAYQPLEKGITVSSAQHFFSFTLESSSASLKGVTVTSKAPLIKQEDDKTIVDPEPLAAASTNVYEILEKTPGVFVDQDGNVYISSTTPAAVYINGREMKMSASDVATMLKNLPPNAVSKIEILRTPSAKYDASGTTGGIVNIVLKKGVKLGMTGSVTAGLQQGVYGNQFVSLNLNNNKGRKSSFINLNYSRRNNFDQIITNRTFAPDSMLSQDAYTVYPGNSYFASYGLTNSWKKNWNVEYNGSIGYNNFDNKTDNLSSIKEISTSDTLSNNLNRVNNNGYTLNIRTSLTLTKKIDTIGSQWDNDFSYNFTRNRSDQVYSSVYYFPYLLSNDGDGNSTGDRNYFTVRSDLRLKTNRRFILETGMKASVLDFKNVAEYFNKESGVRSKDHNRTNTFHYKENINALYVQGSKTLGKTFIAKAGLRIENTNMDGRQIIPTDTSFKIRRTDLFPYVYLSKKVLNYAGYEVRSYLVYRRTITRPGYDQLNPFPRYVDQYLSEIGNPALRPQFTTNYEANISVNERPLVAIGYNRTKDIFTNVIYQADSSNSIAYRTYDNLGSNKEIYFRALAAIPPKKYFFVVGAQYNHNFYEGLYENRPLSFKKGSWVVFTYHQLKLDKRSQVTLNGFVRFKGLQQFYELGTFGSLNATINRQFMKQKLTVTLSMNDIFYTNQNEFTINQGSVNAFGNRRSDTRRAGINIRYNFGIKKKEEGNDMFNVEGQDK